METRPRILIVDNDPQSILDTSQILKKAGYEVLPAPSTYFLMVDLPSSGVELDDESFAKMAVEEAGVATVAVSAFAEDEPPTHLSRLCFAKKDETIDAGVAAMAKARDLARG